MSTITSIRATPNSATTGTTMAPAGVARWRQFGLVFQWQLRRNLTLMPLYVVVQPRVVGGHGGRLRPVDR